MRYLKAGALTLLIVIAASVVIGLLIACAEHLIYSIPIAILCIMVYGVWQSALEWVDGR